VRRLIYGAQARRDIGDIVEWLAESLVSAETIRRFAVDLDNACRRLAANPATIGRIRDDLRSDLRSISFGSISFFFGTRATGSKLCESCMAPAIYQLSFATSAQGEYDAYPHR
jgi:plasmid stabilization system protein ParE